MSSGKVTGVICPVAFLVKSLGGTCLTKFKQHVNNIYMQGTVSPYIDLSGNPQAD